MIGPGMPPPLILDFDGSVLPVSEDECRLSLGEWQEAIRFGCTFAACARLESHLHGKLPEAYGCAFTGSGDYHHLSLLLLRGLARRRGPAAPPLTLVVCDNHPDNMRYPFGLHCGSWVRHAAALAAVAHIHVLGITSGDITARHAWENYLSPFWRKKLTYWSIGRGAGWLRLLGWGEYGRRFDSPGALVDAFLPVLRKAGEVYLSLDKDVFSPELVRTNWDQGVFELDHAAAIMTGCRDKLAGADITGDISDYAYTGRLKRLLSRLDGQTTLTPEEISGSQVVQRELNRRLLGLLEGK